MKKNIKQIKAEQFKIQKAVKYLIDACLNEEGNQKIANPKPVVAHSLRVGFNLLNRGYDNDLVIAGILHDLKEDADVQTADIEKTFGKKVAEIVAAVSWDKEISEHSNKFIDTHKRTKKAGREAIIVSVADHLDNADYYQYSENELAKEKVLEKWKIFLNDVAIIISDDPIYKEYKDKMASIE